jgi:hypothetical protein
MEKEKKCIETKNDRISYHMKRIGEETENAE